MIEPMSRMPRSGVIFWTSVAVVIAVLALGVIVALRGRGPQSIHDRATLPNQFDTCGRTWHGPGAVRSEAEVRARNGDLVVVDPAPLADCPANLHPTPMQTATVVYVRIGSAAYVAYELVGGP